jgi:hypothetical protein
VLQLHRLPPQRDVDGHDDLLDRTKAVGLVRARVARQISSLEISSSSRAARVAR